MQFACMNLSLEFGASAGALTVIVQSGVFFSLLFSALWFKQGLTLAESFALFIGFSGLSLLGWQMYSPSTLLGFMFACLAAISWGLGAVLLKSLHVRDSFQLNLWLSAIPVLPLFALSIAFEGIEAIAQTCIAISWKGMGCILYAGWISNVLAGTLWTAMLTRYAISQVAPFAFFVPLFGLLGGALILQEPLSPLTYMSAGLILLGFALQHVFAEHKGKLLDFRQGMRALKIFVSP
jgi:O-acetylserine/cysteine efflux transporter